MLRVLDNESSISKAQQRFVEQFNQFVDKRIPVKLGYPGGSFEDEVSWCAELDIWICSRTIAGSRYWNAFGIGRPAERKNVSITCEINFPLRGIDRRVAGAFVASSHGEVYVVHRGRIGGGRKGIGKSLFEENHIGAWIDVEDGKVENTVALIGGLHSPRFARQVSHFVSEVGRIKGLVSSGSSLTGISSDVHEFREEFTGKKRYKAEKQIEAQCDHGLIVNKLVSVLRNLGLQVGNDRNRDLYIVDSTDRITTIFEIKTDISTTSLYSAVGQLMLYSIGLAGHPRLVLTIPERVGKTLENKLNELGIALLIYGWSNDEVVFGGLDSLGL